MGSSGKDETSPNPDREKQAAAEAELEREIRLGRKFTPEEAMARMAGPGSMKGASPISPVQQAETEIGNWLKRHLADESGALQMLLHRNLRGSELLLNNLDQPLLALADHCRQLLDSDYLLRELVREADVEWGRRMDERPYFEREGTPHAADPYTALSVREALGGVVEQLSDAADMK